MPRIEPPHCPICGAPFAGLGTQHPCPRCEHKHPHFAHARACTVYAGRHEAHSPIARALHRYKYGRDVTLAPVLGRFLAERFPFRPIYDVIVPVPLHISRLRWRGFNQALLLARPLTEPCGAPLAPFLLRRIRPTPPQVGLDEAARRRNVAGAFALRRGASVAQRSVLLVDDVYTTGTTVDECARVLMAGGAERVDVLVVARAVLHC